LLPIDETGKESEDTWIVGLVAEDVGMSALAGKYEYVKRLSSAF